MDGQINAAQDRGAEERGTIGLHKPCQDRSIWRRLDAPHRALSHESLDSRTGFVDKLAGGCSGSDMRQGVLHGQRRHRRSNPHLPQSRVQGTRRRTPDAFRCQKVALGTEDGPRMTVGNDCAVSAEGIVNLTI